MHDSWGGGERPAQRCAPGRSLGEGMWAGCGCVYRRRAFPPGYLEVAVSKGRSTVAWLCREAQPGSKGTFCSSPPRLEVERLLHPLGLLRGAAKRESPSDAPGAAAAGDSLLNWLACVYGLHFAASALKPAELSNTASGTGGESLAKPTPGALGPGQRNPPTHPATSPSLPLPPPRK